MNDRQEQILNEVLTRAATDWNFRQQLLSDPSRALREAFGLVLPEPFKIRFVERDPELDALIVLPEFRRSVASSELDDNELDVVNGGGGGLTPWSHYR